MKMSKVEAGKLGGKVSKLLTEKRMEEKILQYNLSPKLCLCCNTALKYEKRKNNFCNQSCAAIYNNARKDWDNIVTGPTPKKKDTILALPKIKRNTECACENCGITKKSLNRFCSILCQAAYKQQQSIIEWKIIGKIGKNQLKRYLRETYGDKCSVCNIEEWNSKSIVLELEHKDGNSENNLEENVCLICPNCHSQTDTYKGKNKGNGQHSRRQRYKEGKSF